MVVLSQEQQQQQDSKPPSGRTHFQVRVWNLIMAPYKKRRKGRKYKGRRHRDKNLPPLWYRSIDLKQQPALPRRSPRSAPTKELNKRIRLATKYSKQAALITNTKHKEQYAIRAQETANEFSENSRAIRKVDCTECTNKQIDVFVKYHSPDDDTDHNKAQKDIQAFNLFKNHKVFPEKVFCQVCEPDTPPSPMSRTSGSDTHKKCTKRPKVPKKKREDWPQCNYSVSLFKNTFLSNRNLPLRKIICIINYWLHDHTQRKICNNLNIAETTCRLWCDKCDEACVRYLEMYPPMIGGDNVIVELDESIVCNIAPVGDEPIYLWVFGGVERYAEYGSSFAIPLIRLDDSKKIEILPRTKEILFGYIRKHVRTGSIIYTDAFKTYEGLNSMTEKNKKCYEHDSVNHKVEFVKKDDPIVHTQTIERYWGELKNICKKPGFVPYKLKQYVYKYVFLYSLKPRSVSKSSEQRLENANKWDNNKLHDFLSILHLTHPHKY